MGRTRRVDVGGLVYHALNRASARETLFDGPADYRQFEAVLQERRAAHVDAAARFVIPNRHNPLHHALGQYAIGHTTISSTSQVSR